MRSGFLLCLPALLPAQAPPPGCTTPESRQFDFWVGEWDVVDGQGHLIGTNNVQRIQDGCGLQENWRAGTHTGVSFNTYLAARKAWHQTWIPNNPQGAMLLEGGLQEGRMVMSDAAFIKPGDPLNRITWTPVDKDEVLQQWDVSKDGGKTWSTAFLGRYLRRGSAKGAAKQARLGE